MEYNSLFGAKMVMERLLRQDDLPSEIRHDLELCVAKLDDQFEYCRAVEYQFVEMIKALKQTRYASDIIAKCTYPVTYTKEYIDKVLAQRLTDLANGGRQCLLCGTVSITDGDCCPGCTMEYRMLEENYDKHEAAIRSGAGGNES